MIETIILAAVLGLAILILVRSVKKSVKEGDCGCGADECPMAGKSKDKPDCSSCGK